MNKLKKCQIEGHLGIEHTHCLQPSHNHAGNEDCFDGSCGPNPNKKVWRTSDESDRLIEELLGLVKAIVNDGIDDDWYKDADKAIARAERGSL